jgi:hypothetical protein
MGIGTTTGTLQATIAAGATGLSAAVKVDDRQSIVGFVMPASWVAAGLTFQTSVDGGVTWKEVTKSDGTALAYTVAADKYIVAAPGDWLGVRWLKVRSGTSGTPVNQTGGAVITIVVAQ